MKEQRQDIRKELVASALISDATGNHWFPVTLLDISISGAAVATAERIIVDTTRSFNITLPDSPNPVLLSAKIVNRSPAGAMFRVGIKFLKIDPAAVALIQKYVDTASDGGLPAAADESADEPK
jgi:hypothetical protein